MIKFYENVVDRSNLGLLNPINFPNFREHLHNLPPSIKINPRRFSGMVFYHGEIGLAKNKKWGYFWAIRAQKSAGPQI